MVDQGYHDWDGSRRIVSARQRLNNFEESTLQEKIWIKSWLPGGDWTKLRIDSKRSFGSQWSTLLGHQKPFMSRLKILELHCVKNVGKSTRYLFGTNVRNLAAEILKSLEVASASNIKLGADKQHHHSDIKYKLVTNSSRGSGLYRRARLWNDAECSCLRVYPIRVSLIKHWNYFQKV